LNAYHDEHIANEEEDGRKQALQQRDAYSESVAHTQHRHEERLGQVHQQEYAHDDDEHDAGGVVVNLPLGFPGSLLPFCLN
jgi:hypothetical protein